MLSLPLDNAVEGSSFFDVVVFFTLSTVYQRLSLFTNYLYFIQFLDNPIIRLELIGIVIMVLVTKKFSGLRRNKKAVPVLRSWMIS